MIEMDDSQGRTLADASAATETPSASRRLAGDLSVVARAYGLASLLVLVGIAITVAIRAILFGFHSRDLEVCILPWCDSIKNLGLTRALKEGGIDYNPTYVYVLWLVTKLPVDRVVSIKLFTILCDYACALALAFLVYRLSRSKLRAVVAAFALLLAPTVVFNGALWAQCDMFYTLPLVLALSAFLGKRHYLTTALFGVAIAIKLQAMFLFPLLGIWVLRKALPWRALLALPVAYFLCLVPAWIAGSRLVDLLMIYPNQTSRYSGLTLGAPTIFQFFPDNGEWFGSFGTWFAIGITFMVTVACIFSKERLSPEHTVKMTALFACLVPFLMPRMHERYIFLGDVVCILYAFLFPRRLWIAILVVGASFISYFPFLFGQTPVPMGIAALILGLVSAFLTYDMLCVLYPNAFSAIVATDSEL